MFRCSVLPSLWFGVNSTVRKATCYLGPETAICAVLDPTKLRLIRSIPTLRGDTSKEAQIDEERSNCRSKGRSVLT